MKTKPRPTPRSARLSTISFVVIAAWVSLVPAADKKPNIHVIWGDDVGIANISDYSGGVMGYETPHIDRIAKEGTIMEETLDAIKAEKARAAEKK
jgi:hypothetical protein